MRVVDFERELSSRLPHVPRLVLAELVGAWVTEGPSSTGPVSLLVVAEAADDDTLKIWKLEHLDPVLAELEQEFDCKIEVIPLTRGRFEREARRGSGLLVGIYTHPRAPLVSSIDEQLDAETTAALAGNAMALSEHVSDAGLTSAII